MNYQATPLNNEPWLMTLEGHAQLVSSLKELAALPKAQWPSAPDSAPKEPSPNKPITIVPIKGSMLLGLSPRMRALLELFDIPVTDTAIVAAQLRELAQDESVKVVILDINSTGGRVTGTPELAAAVRELSAKKYVYAFTADMACSAAYWVASQCDAIYATPSAQLGSIGVILPLVDSRLKLEKEGIVVDALSAGKFKTAGLTGTSLTDEQRALLQARVDDDWALFKSAVNTRRSIAPEYMEGQCLSGEKALTSGLVDAHINSLPQLVDKLQKRHKL